MFKGPRTEKCLPRAILQDMNLGRINVPARDLVMNEGVSRPTVPKAAHDFHELPCPFISNVTLHVFRPTEIKSIFWLGRCNDVPSRAALADVIE